MRESHVCKAVDAAAVTDEQLGRINAYTRRALTREEVFVFSVVLCDNEIDRDLERFPTASLEKLKELFPGKTGVFDHAPTAENQSARIFETRLEETGEVNSVGKPYRLLKAWAYMVRCEKNADLILEIDAGIKKEVSVGCAVEEIRCSICDADRKAEGCTHKKGEVYGGRLCYHLLVNPTDAYEWSFVAVPAQKRAGVVKRTGGGTPGAVPVEKGRLERLEKLARLGERYEEELRGSVVKLGLLGQPDLTADQLEQLVSGLDAPLLEALQKSFGSAAKARYPIGLQLGRPGEEERADGSAFRI